LSGVHTVHGKSGKSWDLRISFFRPGKLWHLCNCQLWKIIENLSYVWQISSSVKIFYNRGEMCDVTNIKICKIMGLGSIFRKNKMKKRTLVKNQLVSANWRVGIGT